MTSDYFVNPYNFVSLEEQCDKKSRETGNLTGKIMCSLQTLTPMFIPSDEKTKDGVVDFFHYSSEPSLKNNKSFRPVIPGSEIRGVIRSVFEAAFNGCLSQVNEERFHRRSMEAKEAGLLYKENGDWKLIEADKWKIRRNEIKGEVKEGDIKYFHKGLLYNQQQKNSKKVYIHLSEKANKPIFAFYPKFGGEKYEISQEVIELLKLVLTLYKENNEKKDLGHSGYRKYRQLLNKIDNEGVKSFLPVYYYQNKENNMIYLAPAAFSQEVFEHTLRLILEKHGGYEPCSCKENTCLACHVFGFVNGKEMKASRIRFSDGESNSEIYRLEEVTLPVLETPHPDTVEFYTKKVEGADYWTYDYKIKRNEKKRQGKSKRDRLTLDEIQIRGRKFYWHHKPARSAWNLLEDKEEEVIVNPIGTHKKFNFEIYFECLTKEELARLCNVLDINHSATHAHKIGRAKPFGFGSVQIKIKKILTRTIHKETGEFSLDVKKREDYLKNKIPVESELLELLKFKPQLHEKSISYPKVKVKNGSINDKASHQWFTENRSNKKFKQLLPTVDEEISKESKCINHKWLKVLKK